LRNTFTQIQMRAMRGFRFVTPTVLTARAASKVTDIYMYRFSRVSPLNRSMYGNEISVGSNADDPNVEFFQRAFETLRAEQGR
jgi:carboxylesterase type B